jgi:hypothetical protein
MEAGGVVRVVKIVKIVKMTVEAKVEKGAFHDDANFLPCQQLKSQKNEKMVHNVDELAAHISFH